MLDLYNNRGGFKASLAYAIEAMGETAFDFYEKFSEFFYRNGFQHRSHKKEDLYRIFWAFGQEAGIGQEPGADPEVSIGAEGGTGCQLEQMLECDLVETMNFDAVKKFKRKGWIIG